MADSYGKRYRFPTTHWSLIGRAGEPTREAQREALNQLLTLYWRALRSHLIGKRGIQASEADDLVQGFIENRILEKDLVSRADSERGRFRTLLATALDRYVSNEMQRRYAKKRTPDRAASLGETEGHTPAGIAAPDDSLDVAWARETLAEALRRMKSECQASQRLDIWHVFLGRVVDPILEGAAPLGYEEIVEQFGYASPAQASNALVTGKRMFLRALRTLVAEYATDEESIAGEINDLIQILSR